MKGRPKDVAPPPQAPVVAGFSPAAGLSARLIVAAVFIFSGLHKLSAPPQEFAAVIDAYLILSPRNTLPLATALPWVELGIGLCLAGGYLTRACAPAAAGMLGVFILALGSTIARGLTLENCGCFGPGIHLTPFQAIGLDSTLAALAALAYRSGGRLFALDNWVDQGLD